ncbi:cytochrome c oxidase subunit II [Methylocapsa polymorpha]|uniref:Cytochrome c oxidase subunit 2 n=1 Tax=Methylocapsa polymorpha TaxID=3080828 RepID=A0ABZ0HQN5_9HYPH|nr:cytochrome c oxidase subunit II [Methylocapsa sp. RX1]
MRFASTTARRARDFRAGFFHTSFWLAALVAGAAQADGYPEPGQIGLQEAVTPIAEEMHVFHNWILLPIIIAISVFVLGLLAYVIFRFNENANPTPSRTTHNSTLEVIWTVLPVMILVVIAIPSFRLLTHQIVVPPADVTVKVTGKQWYWTYNYPQDQGGGFEFDSYMVPQDALKPGDIRLLSVDNEAVVPVGKIVRLQVTAADVIHSFTIPSFGIRIDAVPGRLNETWFKAEREGVYYGQCSKLCGQDHAYMPISIRVVSAEDYAAWLVEASKKFASTGAAPVHFADNTAPRVERR